MYRINERGTNYASDEKVTKKRKQREKTDARTVGGKSSVHKGQRRMTRNYETSTFAIYPLDRPVPTIAYMTRWKRWRRPAQDKLHHTKKTDKGPTISVETFGMRLFGVETEFYRGGVSSYRSCIRSVDATAALSRVQNILDFSKR